MSNFNPLEYLPAPTQQPTTHAAPAAPQPQVNAPASDAEHVELVISRIEAASRDITATEKDWFDALMSLASTFGEAGRDYAHRISRFYPGYNAAETDRKYTNCLKGNKGAVGLGTFFHLAKENSIDVTLPKLPNSQNYQFTNSRTTKEQTTASDTPPAQTKNGKIGNLEIMENLETSAASEESLPSLVGTLSEEGILDTLPSFFCDLLRCTDSQAEQDLLLLGMLVTLSGCLPHITGEYDGRTCYANLFLYIEGHAAAGKGILTLCREILEPIEDELEETYKKEKAKYDAALAENPSSREPKPVRHALFIPGNSTATKVVQDLHENSGSGIMFETESDMLSAMFKSEHGNYSDTLRKAFHHEPVSFSRRKDNERVRVKQPRMTVVLSGTPKQLAELVPSPENGLLSRIIFWHVPMIAKWRDPFRKTKNSRRQLTGELKSMIHTFYLAMQGSEDVSFAFTAQQARRFNAFFEREHDNLASIYGNDLLPSIRRLGLIMFRIAMTLSAVRRIDGDDFTSTMTCSDRDFDLAMSIVKVLLVYTIRTFRLISESAGSKPASIAQRAQESILALLPDEFRRADALSVCAQLSLGRSSADNYVSALVKAGRVEKVGFGMYRKIKSVNFAETH